MQRNYYYVLGIREQANTPQIRRAFRQKTHLLHPERSEQDAGSFESAQEAFDVLHDPLERARYDRDLAGRGSTQPRQYLRSRKPMDLLADFERHLPSLEQVIDLFKRNFEPHKQGKVHHVQELSVEVVVSAKEAEHGGYVALGVPVFRPCDACAGTGSVGSAKCDACDGRGMDRISSQVDVWVPAHTADDTTIPVSLQQLGVRNLRLNVLVRVAPVG